jgi:hypothetical protein
VCECACLSAPQPAHSILAETHRRERVVEKNDVSVGVNGTGQRHARLLAATQCHTALADLRQISVLQNVKVGFQLACARHFVIPLLREREGEERERKREKESEESERT